MDKNTLKHKKLIEVLNKEFGYNLSLQNEEHFGEQINLDTNDINQAVIAFCDILNIHSGSTGNRDLYKLLQKYLTDTQIQISVNEKL